MPMPRMSAFPLCYRVAFARIGLVVAAAVLLSLAGCREEEQDRPLLYDKGSYQGQADEELSEEQFDALRQRGQHQKF